MIWGLSTFGQHEVQRISYETLLLKLRAVWRSVCLTRCAVILMIRNQMSLDLDRSGIN